MNQLSNKQVYYRLTALWVLCEAMLGGVIHAMKIPVSGLIVGSAAVVCICLIAEYNSQRGAIIKATIIVCIFKMILSPQAPVLAYAAVLFQGIMGEVLFFNRRTYRLSSLVLGIVALVESGVQRIIVLTVVYGNGFWRVINDFINGIVGQKHSANFSLIIGAAYVGLHVIVGIMVGWWVGLVPQKIGKWKKEIINGTALANQEPAFSSTVPAKHGRIRKGLLVVWAMLTVLYLQSVFKIGEPLLPAKLPLLVLIRSVIVILTWYFVVGPIMALGIKRWLEKRQKSSQQEMEVISQLLPAMKGNVVESWRIAGSRPGIHRLMLFSRILLVKTLLPEKVDTNVFILKGEINSGKTTSLLEWINNISCVHGILTPIVDGKRCFFDIGSKEYFPMEADAGEEETIRIGRYEFSKASFKKAIQAVHDAKSEQGWIVIDEIGPLELRGEGFAQVLKEVLLSSSAKLLLVVRESIINEVILQFGLEEANVIGKVSEIPGKYCKDEDETAAKIPEHQNAG